MQDPVTATNMPSYQKAILQTVVYKQVREIVNRVLKLYEINTTQWMILGILQIQPNGQKISVIARTLQVEVPLITTLAQSLLKNGYVTQTADDRDKRSKPLTLTDIGSNLITTIEVQLSERLKVLEVGITNDALDNYFRTLQALITNAEVVA